MNSSGFTDEQIEKVVNTFVFLREKMKPFYLTSALKFTYFLDEFHIQKHGIPFFNFTYQIWQRGPVVKDLYFELSKPKVLSDYIEVVPLVGGGREIIPKTNVFDDSEFTQSELNLLDQIREKYWTMQAQELVSKTHDERGLWFKTAQRHNLLDSRNEMTVTSTEFEIDFRELLSDDPIKLSRFESFKEFKQI